MTSSPLSRAEQAREELRGYVYECGMASAKEADGEALRLIPESAIILTAAEAEQVRQAVGLCYCGYLAGGRKCGICKALALLSAGQPEQEDTE